MTNMKKILAFSLFCLLFTGLRSQNFDWAKREGLWAYDYGYGIANDNIGNVYVSGKYELNSNFSGTILPCEGNHDIFVAKYTSTGALSWVRTGGGHTGDYARALACDGVNYVYVAGEIQGYGNTIVFPGSPITLTCTGDNDVFLTKYDLDGNLLWARNAGGNESDKALGITYDNADNVYVCGYFNGTATFGESTNITSAGDNDIFLAKYDMDGNFEWVRKAGSAARDEAKAVKCDAVGNVYICGMYKDGASFGAGTLTSPNGAFNTFLAKYTTDGALKWVQTGGGNFNDLAWSLTLDNSNKIYTTGEFNANANFDGLNVITEGHADVFVNCYDTLGNIQWVKRGGGDLVDVARGIGTDGTNLYITGQFGSTANFGSHAVIAADSSDIFMVGLNNSGDFLWATSVTGLADSVEFLGYESGNSICAEASGNVYATGSLLDGGNFGSTSLDKYSRTDIFISKISQGPDVTAPVVNSFSPTDNGVNINKSSNLVIAFSEAVQKGTGDIVIKEGGITTQTIPVNGSNVSVSINEVTIDLPSDFSENAAVNVEMAAGVFKDMANNNYAGINNATTWNFNTPDLTPPSTNSFSPADDLTDVAKGTNLAIIFNEPVQKGTGNILIKEEGILTQTISVSSLNVTVTTNTVIIDPASDFTDGSSVNIEIAAGVFKDLAGNNHAGITGAEDWDFTIVDMIAPIVNTYSPTDGMVDVAKNANLLITFSETVQKGNGNIIIKEEGTITQIIPVNDENVTMSGNMVTIDPAIDFTNGSSINVEVDAGTFKDLSNNDYEGTSGDALNWDFKIIDLIAPVVNSYSPEDNAINIAKNSNLVMTFSEPVKKGTGNILIKEAGILTQTIPVTGPDVIVSGNTVTINSPTDFNENSSVNIEMADGVFKDMANNHFEGIDDDVTWNFTIIDDSPPMATSFVPADESINVSKSATLVVTFNEAVKKGVGYIVIKEAGVVKQLISVVLPNVTISGNTVYIDPPFDFTDSALVNIEIGAEVFEDMANNKCAGINDPLAWNFTVEKATSLTEINPGKDFDIYPNPGNGSFTIDLSRLTEQKIELSTFNAVGQVISKSTHKSPSKINVDLSQYESGIYFIEIKTEDQKVLREKIILQ